YLAEVYPQAARELAYGGTGMRALMRLGIDDGAYRRWTTRGRRGGTGRRRRGRLHGSRRGWRLLGSRLLAHRILARLRYDLILCRFGRRLAGLAGGGLQYGNQSAF